MTRNPTVSVVVPCHNEAGNVEALYRAVVAALDDAPDLELLFVDDGSTDDTLARVKELRRGDPRVKFLRLMTNYGHQKALLAGLRHVEGDVAVTLDADLQHPPRYIRDLIDRRRETGAEVVVARRRGTQSGLLKERLSAAFYRVFRLATGLTVIPGASDFRLYSRRARQVLCAVREREPFLRGMVPNLRLPTATIEYELELRREGEPSYSLPSSARMGILALLRFS
ncbi:MAG: glycosyltransferase family 2 protein, partial [Thermoanaerobaculia bacterium]|nr:glycosyltransferase family 2 protein [Thermoanaerobaculia bacterium]